jgi:cell division septum initiation protein DivIVA
MPAPQTLADLLSQINGDATSNSTAADAVAQAQAALVAAQQAQAATANTLTADTSAFAQAIHLLGGEVVDPSTTPATVYVSTDGQSFTTRQVPSLSSPIPTFPAAAS